MVKSNSSADGYAIGNQVRAAEIKAALERAAASDTGTTGDRHKTQGDTHSGTGRGSCSK